MIPNVVHDPTGLQVSFEDFDLSLGPKLLPGALVSWSSGIGIGSWQWEMGDEKDPMLGRKQGSRARAWRGRVGGGRREKLGGGGSCWRTSKLVQATTFLDPALPMFPTISTNTSIICLSYHSTPFNASIPALCTTENLQKTPIATLPQPTCSLAPPLPATAPPQNLQATHAAACRGRISHRSLRDPSSLSLLPDLTSTAV